MPLAIGYALGHRLCTIGHGHAGAPLLKAMAAMGWYGAARPQLHNIELVDGAIHELTADGVAECERRPAREQLCQVGRYDIVMAYIVMAHIPV